MLTFCVKKWNAKKKKSQWLTKWHEKRTGFGMISVTTNSSKIMSTCFSLFNTRKTLKLTVNNLLKYHRKTQPCTLVSDLSKGCHVAHTSKKQKAETRQEALMKKNWLELAGEPTEKLRNKRMQETSSLWWNMEQLLRLLPSNTTINRSSKVQNTGTQLQEALKQLPSSHWKPPLDSPL